MTDLARVVEATSKTLGSLLDDILTDLGTVAGRTSELFTEAPSAVELEPLRPLVERMLSKYEGLIDGAGVATAPGSLRDEETWLQWWRFDGEHIVFTPHNLNPASLNYYDYTEMTWFERPVLSGQPEVTGPYIDFGGTDTKIITVAVPVDHEPGNRSVVGADLSMDHLERRFLQSLGVRTESIALVSESGKIITSNTARLIPGTRLNADNPPALSHPVPSYRMDRTPWQIAAW